MHIPVGKFEGKEIKHCGKGRDILSTRELTVKEEIFDIIGTRIIEGDILDINDPSGLYGIESLSRGAERVTFLGAEKDCVEALKKNLKSVGAGSDAILNATSAEEYFKKLKADDKFKVIFFEIERQEEVGTEAQMVNHLTDDGLLIMFVPIMGGFQVPVAVERACIQESRDCEEKVVLIISKNREQEVL
jgi:16S rRNA (guanine966-N2)-methyltransferase